MRYKLLRKYPSAFLCEIMRLADVTHVESYRHD